MALSVLLAFTNLVKFTIYKLFKTFGNDAETDFTWFCRYVVSTFKVIRFDLLAPVETTAYRMKNALFHQL